jgi:ubiquitin
LSPEAATEAGLEEEKEKLEISQLDGEEAAAEEDGSKSDEEATEDKTEELKMSRTSLIGKLLKQKSFICNLYFISYLWQHQLLLFILF